MMAYVPDTSNFVPVIAGAGTLEYQENLQVAISEEPFNEENVTWNRLSFVRSALASNINIGEDGNVVSVCDNGEASCCPVQADGSFTCYHPLKNASVTQLYIAAIDKDGNMGESHTETINGNLLWTIEAPKDLTMAGSDLAAVTSGIAVKATLSENQWSVKKKLGDKKIRGRS